MSVVTFTNVHLNVTLKMNYSAFNAAAKSGGIKVMLKKNYSVLRLNKKGVKC